MHIKNYNKLNPLMADPLSNKSNWVAASPHTPTLSLQNQDKICQRRDLTLLFWNHCIGHAKQSGPCLPHLWFSSKPCYHRKGHTLHRCQTVRHYSLPVYWWRTLDDVIKWKHFPRYWPFVRGIHRSPVNLPHKGQLRGALIFSLICTRTNIWVNNRDSGDLRRHCAHYDVTVMNYAINAEVSTCQCYRI